MNPKRKTPAERPTRRKAEAKSVQLVPTGTVRAVVGIGGGIGVCGGGGGGQTNPYQYGQQADQLMTRQAESEPSGASVPKLQHGAASVSPNPPRGIDGRENLSLRTIRDELRRDVLAALDRASNQLIELLGGEIVDVHGLSGSVKPEHSGGAK